MVTVSKPPVLLYNSAVSQKQPHRGHYEEEENQGFNMMAISLLAKGATHAVKKAKNKKEQNFTSNVSGKVHNKNAELPPSKIQIYTHNVRQETKNLMEGERPWSDRKKGVIKSILENSSKYPTLVGLQEVKQNQLNDIMNGLGKDWAFFGVGREDGKAKGEFAPILYKKSEWELISGKTCWLCETPNKPCPGWDAAFARTVTVTVLKNKKNGKVVNFLNTHYDHKGKQARKEASKLIIDLMKKSEGVSLLCGDFNSESNADAYKTLEKSLLDTSRHCQKRSGYDDTITNFKLEGGSTIDFIWTTQEVPILEHEVLTHERDGLVISDHRPVVSVVEI